MSGVGSAGGGSAGGAGGCSSSASAGAGSSAASGAADLSIVPTTPPMGMVSPSDFDIFKSPSASASISRVTLSVSRTKSNSPLRT